MYLTVPLSSIILARSDMRPKKRNSLKIIPAKPLGPGEYAMSMRAAFLNLFCFGVDE